ncbi:MAG: hypothetical protein AVDCRST_MAG59-2294, partial [uncultured Thermomicrobiales bacterium]
GRAGVEYRERGSTAGLQLRALPDQALRRRPGADRPRRRGFTRVRGPRLRAGSGHGRAGPPARPPGSAGRAPLRERHL